MVKVPIDIRHVNFGWTKDTGPSLFRVSLTSKFEVYVREVGIGEPVLLLTQDTDSM